MVSKFQIGCRISLSTYVGFFEVLPIHFFDKTALFSIASTVGFPLKIDTSTSTLARPNITRVCADLDLGQSLPNRRSQNFSLPIAPSKGWNK